MAMDEDIIIEECSWCNDWTPHKETEEGIFCTICGTEYKEPEDFNDI